MCRPIRLLILACTVLSATAGTALANTSFIELRDRASTKSPASLEAWAVDVDVAPFASHAPALFVDLFDGQRYRIGRYDVEEREPGNLVWRGRFADGGQAILTLVNGHVVGILYTPDGPYELTTSPDGQVLQKIAPEAFEPCFHEAHDDTGIEGRAHGEVDFGWSHDVPQPASASSRRTKTISTIDVMIVYTPQARNAAGGTSSIQAVAQSAVDVSNSAFSNSQTNARFNLVHTAEVSYNDSGNIQSDRDWLRGNSIVKGWRDQHDADMVSLLVENGGGYCGIAFLLGNESASAFHPNAYQVTARTCAVGNLSYPHEHGHNLGLQHNPENGASTSQAYRTYAYGHYHNGSYRTVMSYANPCSSGCFRAPFFSNPDVVFLNHATGTSSRDNARVIDLVAPIAANYRTPCTSAPATPSYITGPNHDLCQSATERYQTPSVSGTDSYRWEIVGSTTFTQTTTTNQLWLSGHFFSPGYYTIRVRAQNGCGNSGWRSAGLIILSNNDPECGGCSGRFCF